MEATKNLFQSTQGIDNLATGAKVLGQVTQGLADKKQADYQADQLEANAKASKAKASRSAEEERRRGDIILSNARAAMAGNGGVTTDSGATQNLAEIEQVVDFNSLASIYDGDSQAESFNRQAQGKRFAGRNARTAGYAGGISSLMQKYSKRKVR